jgi:hypothetical protein
LRSVLFLFFLGACCFIFIPSMDQWWLNLALRTSTWNPGLPASCCSPLRVPLESSDGAEPEQHRGLFEVWEGRKAESHGAHWGERGLCCIGADVPWPGQKRDIMDSAINGHAWVNIISADVRQFVQRMTSIHWRIS